MKILLDENTSEDLIDLLPGYVVVHLEKQGWKGLQNGKLLSSAVDGGFSVMITVDKQMQHQQNFCNRPLSLIVLDIHPNNIPNQIACLGEIITLLPDVQPGEIYVIKGPHASRHKAVN